jgi:Helix-turn-helix domain
MRAGKQLPDSNRRLVVSEVARRYRTSAQMVYTWVREGVIPPGCVIRLRRKILFDPVALDEWEARGGSIHPNSSDATAA